MATSKPSPPGGPSHHGHDVLAAGMNHIRGQLMQLNNAISASVGAFRSSYQESNYNHRDG